MPYKVGFCDVRSDSLKEGGNRSNMSMQIKEWILSAEKAKFAHTMQRAVCWAVIREACCG